MKGLIIIGVARCGKSTLSHLVSRQLVLSGHKVNLLTGDLIKYAYNELFRHSLRYKLFWRPLKNIFPKYCRRMIDEELTQRNRYKMVYEYLMSVTWQPSNVIPVFEVVMEPAIAAKLFPAEKFRIVCVASPNIAPLKKSRIMKKVDKKAWNGKMSDAELLDLANELVALSKRLVAQAQELGIAVVDTSHDYHGELQKFADNIVEFLK